MTAGIPVVELSECCRCEICISVCPAVFRMSQAGYIEVVDQPGYPESEVNDAIKNCPSKCIQWLAG